MAVDKIDLTQERLALLNARGIETHYPPGVIKVPGNVVLEAPASLKWLKIDHSLHMGAFSYAVSGYCFAVRMGRYCSFGEEVQIGRQDHPIDWLSTSPFQYLKAPLFEVGGDFTHAEQFAEYRSHLAGKVAGTKLRITEIGHDVWIGHGAYVKAGVKIGTGAIIAAYSAVVKDVPPYAIVGGNPAKVLKYRVPEKLIARLLATEWWQFAPWQLKNVAFNHVEKAIGQIEALKEAEPPFKPDVLRLGDLFADE